MERQDDRTTEQKKTHRWGVVATDKFMSGWGQASNGLSKCAWAVKDGLDINKVERWVDNRNEMKYVNVVDLNTYRPSRATAHFHIYVVDEGHPSLV